MNFSVDQTDRDTGARLGRLTTVHGAIETPAFMPVGTLGPVKGIDPHDLEQLGFRLMLNNAYHLYLRPGHKIIAEMGGLHRFTGWPGAILTDSGGFQMFSLAKLCRITDDGVSFQSHIDGSAHFITPETAIEVQEALGADIIMINNAINQVLSRTIVTSLTVVLVLIPLTLGGGEVLHDFSLALLWGVIFGTYSSIFVASPLLLLWPGGSGRLLKRA